MFGVHAPLLQYVECKRFPPNLQYFCHLKHAVLTRGLIWTSHVAGPCCLALSNRKSLRCLWPMLLLCVCEPSSLTSDFVKFTLQQRITHAIILYAICDQPVWKYCDSYQMDQHENKQKRTLIIFPPSHSPSKNDKKTVFMRWSLCAFWTCNQDYFNRTCGMFSNSVLPAEGEDVWLLARLRLEPCDPPPARPPVLRSSEE